MKLSGTAIHSRCHGPVARSKSCTMASSISPACCRTALAVARISSDEIGLRFCGMVEEPPRPFTKGSCASPPNSVAIISMMSVAILASVPVTRPRKPTASARPSRATCQVIGGCARPSSAQNASCTASPLSPSEAEVPAAPANWPISARGRSCSRRSACRSMEESQIAAL